MGSEDRVGKNVPPLRMGEPSRLVRHRVEVSEMYGDVNRENICLSHPGRLSCPDAKMCVVEFMGVRDDLVKRGSDILDRLTSVSLLVRVFWRTLVILQTFST